MMGGQVRIFKQPKIIIKVLEVLRILDKQYYVIKPKSIHSYNQGRKQLLSIL